MPYISTPYFGIHDISKHDQRCNTAVHWYDTKVQAVSPRPVAGSKVRDRIGLAI